MQEIFNAEDGDHARVAAKAFAIEYGAKFPKAVAKIIDDLDVLLTFYDYPAEHWIHLRTTNPIVISSPSSGVLDVHHRAVGSRDPRAGRGYLPRSITWVSGRFGVRSAGGAAVVAA